MRNEADLSNRDILYTAFDVVPSPKGASTHITYFTRGLTAAGCNVTLITAGESGLPEHDHHAGATLLRVPPTDDANFLKRALAYGEYVRRHVESAPPYALYHVRDVWGGLPLLDIPRHTPLLVEVNGLPSIELKYHYPALAGSGVIDKLRQSEITLLQRADAVICVSEVTRAYLRSLGVAPEKITVISNGVDPALFAPSPLSPLTAQPTLLYIGTLADWQGLQTAVLALPHILQRQPVCLRIIGRGRKRHRKLLEKLALKLGVENSLSIEDAVPYEHIPALIAAADVCLAPLGFNDRNVTQGCCPIKVLEYMACARPLAASNLPVVRELVREDIDALLFSPDSPLELARVVLALLEDREQAARLASHAAERLRQRFTWAGAQQKLLAVYDQLLR